MEQSKHIGLRVPASILERVDTLIGQLGADRTAVILALLRQALTMPGSVEQRLHDVEQRLTTVEQRLTTVEQSVEPPKLSRDLTTVEQSLTTVEQKNVEPKEPKLSRENPLQAPPKQPAVRSYPSVASGKDWKTMTKLGRIYDFDSSNANRDAKVRGETMLSFLQRKTGLEWESNGDKRPLYRVRQANH